MPKSHYDSHQLDDLVLQMMETELGGEQVYRTALTCAINPDLKKPKAERVFQEAVDPEPRKKQDEADVDFESDANPDFNINDFGSVGPDDSVLADADADEMDEAADANEPADAETASENETK